MPLSHSHRRGNDAFDDTLIDEERLRRVFRRGWLDLKKQLEIILHLQMLKLAVIAQSTSDNSEDSQEYRECSGIAGVAYPVDSGSSIYIWQMKPSGQRPFNNNATQLASSENAFWN